jgi:hypothetical protein
MITEICVANESRRRFLKSLAALAAICLSPKIVYGMKTSANGWQTILRNLAEIESIRNIGNKYLVSTNGIHSFNTLLISLKNTNLSSLDENSDAHEISATINKVIREDFINNNVVILDNWWLSETEVKLCALAALAA